MQSVSLSELIVNNYFVDQIVIKIYIYFLIIIKNLSNK